MHACMYVYHQATVVFILGLPFLCKEHSRKEEADYKAGPTLSTHGGDVGNIGRGKGAKPRSSATEHLGGAEATEHLYNSASYN